MLIWQNYLHILRSLFCFIFLIFSICAGGCHHISSLLPKGICEGSWSCRNSNCSCSSCTWRLYRNFLLHWKKSSLYTIRTHKTEKSVPSLNTLQLKLCSLLSCQTTCTTFSCKSSKSERLLWTKEGMKKWAKEFCQELWLWRENPEQQPCNTVKYERPAFKQIPLPWWLEEGTPTTTLFIETLVLYLHHRFLLHRHLLAVPEFP